jgi:hypothetical protein
VFGRILSIVEKSPLASLLNRRLNEVKAFLPDLDRIEAQERKWREAKDATHLQPDGGL